MSSLPPPELVATPDGLDRLADALASCAAVAVDTESNSLHAYRERVCLIQFSTTTADYIVDPVALPDLSPLAPLFADPAREKIFHAAEGDLLCLGRDFSFEFANIFDTMTAARALGWAQVGLAAILDAQFGVKLNKAHQRADWGRRPLTADMLDYARLDTHYLLALRARVFDALMESGHWPEAREEFERLSRLRGRAAAGPDPLAFWRAKGARDLAPQRAAVLKAVFAYREAQAERIDQPPFKVMGEATLLELARLAPSHHDDLKRVPGMTPAQIRRHGQALLEAVRKGLRDSAPQPPPVEREPDDVRDRYDRLHGWRKERARVRGVESDVILPRSVLRDMARRPPQTIDEMADVADFGPKRRELYGQEILGVLASTDAPRTGASEKLPIR